MTTRFIPVGSGSNNQCCVCGGLGSSADSANAHCSGYCTEDNNTIGSLYGPTPGEDDTPCFPQTCCPCPPTGTERTVILTLNATCASGGLDDEEITLSYGAGIPLCTGGDIFDRDLIECYEGFEDSPDELGRTGVLEKYGKIGHIFPIIDGDEGYDGTSGPCSGVKADISLCCCNQIGSQVKLGSTGECHTCNYTLMIDFQPFFVDPVSPFETYYCHCPSGYVDYPLNFEERMAIHLGSEHADANTSISYHKFSEFSLVNSSCEPFYLEYEATGLYWNCGPCMNGQEEYVDDEDRGSRTVSIYATITEPGP